MDSDHLALFVKKKNIKGLYVHLLKQWEVYVCVCLH